MRYGNLRQLISQTTRVSASPPEMFGRGGRYQLRGGHLLQPPNGSAAPRPPASSPVTVAFFLGRVQGTYYQNVDSTPPYAVLDIHITGCRRQVIICTTVGAKAQEQFPVPRLPQQRRSPRVAGSSSTPPVSPSTWRRGPQRATSCHCGPRTRERTDAMLALTRFGASNDLDGGGIWARKSHSHLHCGTASLQFWACVAR